MSENRPAELRGRVAVVTGASAAIGGAIAVALADAGADLVLTGRNTDAVAPIAEAVSARQRRALVVRCDVTRPDDVGAMVSAARSVSDGRIDILVNAAGGNSGIWAPVWETKPADFAAILAANLTASFLTMSATLPVMIERGSGRIINIAGTYGLRGRAGRAAYSAAKWGVRGLTKSAALEAGVHDITVNCICPGMVEGNELDAAVARLAEREGMSSEAALERLLRGYALRRASTPEDIANAVVFLASDTARQITGQDIAVDGGWAI